MPPIERFPETIELLLECYLGESLPDPLGLRQIASRLHALPVFLDIGDCFAIRPGGEIISVSWDTPGEIRVEEAPRLRNLALYQGSKKHADSESSSPLDQPMRYSARSVKAEGSSRSRAIEL